ncbi:MAG: NHL repeat-containing protein [Coriobacteriia bacterium]
MADETLAAHGPTGRRRASATRIGLSIVLVILVFMLIALGYAIYKVALPSSGSGDSTSDDETGLEWVRSMYSFGPSPEQAMNAPVATAVGGDGTIYAVDTQTNMVMAFNPDGSIRRAVSLMQAIGSEAQHMGPKSLMIAENGDVYVGANVGQGVYIFDRNLEFIRSFPLETIPFAIEQDGDTLLISATEGILRFTDEGEFVGPFALRGIGDGEVNLPQAMVMTDDGTLFVADSMSGRVQAFDREGELLWKTEFGSILTDDVTPSTDASNTSGFQVPSGIAVDANGRLVVVDMQMMEIFVLDPDNGSILEQYGEFGYDDGQLIYPMGIAYDSDRDWFALADMGNSRIQVLRIPGSAQANLVAAARRSFVGPVWVCGLPLFITVLLGLAAVLRRKRASVHDEDRSSAE